MEKEKNQENFFARLFDVIDLPLFLLLGLVLVSQVISTQSFYFEYVIYFGIGGFIINTFLYGFSGFRAAKNKEKDVKPWLAGLFTALIVGIFSLILSIIVLVYFPTHLDDMMFTNDGTSTVTVGDSDSDSFKDEEFEGEEVVVEEDFSSEFESMNKGGWDNPLLTWTLIGGGISLLFSSLFGAICGLIGGAIGKD